MEVINLLDMDSVSVYLCMRHTHTQTNGWNVLLSLIPTDRHTARPLFEVPPAAQDL